MEEKEFDPVSQTEENEEIDTVSVDIAKKESLWPRVRNTLPTLAIWARYLLPLASLLALFVMSFFYNVKIYSGGAEQELSIFQLYINTFKGMHNYLGGVMLAGRTSFYVILTVGAIVGVLCFLAALFFTGLAAVTSAVAFLAGHESEKSDKMKLVFKIAFPGRVWLFLSDLLILVPLLYPHFFSLVGRNFLSIGGEEVIFVLLNRPLILGAILLVLTLVLAILSPRYERRKKMNMFLLHRSEETEEDAQEDEAECEDEEEQESE